MIDPTYYTRHACRWGKRKRHARQASICIATQGLPRSAAHPSYAPLNLIVDEHEFNGFVEELCALFYADEVRPWSPPSRNFRVLLSGYFEGCASSLPPNAWPRCPTGYVIARAAGSDRMDSGGFTESDTRVRHRSAARSRVHKGRSQAGWFSADPSTRKTAPAEEAQACSAPAPFLAAGHHRI